ncbi:MULTISPECIES: DUF4129 domain-containing protein [Mycolicibacterium]|uniref:Protein-glutamine gamma-glutamyltransferase-like C-terminal domain-containing protein n=1 Tax=Mycolicibacterium vanbaalenii (strain DSM 7251 / JCM 13017 / BCRC 16820 / KCTC 9966 / NRRL B-24157 / PYR-1) TaxID=350058 RepID=A1T1H9_MYCVP|nr:MULTISPECIES: DUF4129 domain-containing protein [Mycolicibacterium]ABM11029.1 conserved hypothetical protein [Mycolicibacterium vanbaalenii PYR-1]MCV7128236.1 DUF4129 domain-containing protein [Mycolicibacterium vanbaalenii PYR-1]PQP46711.1 DUF4129 domain-containing protein [Mycolicibacterium austroafricanum]
MPDKIEPADNRAVVRTVAVAVLLLLAVVALRGYLPDGDRAAPPDERPESGTGSLVAVAAMLAVSIGIIAISILAQGRHRLPAPDQGGPVRDLREPWPGLRWRPLLIAAAALLVWSVLMLLLMRWASPGVVDDAPPPAPGADARAETDRGPAPQTPTGDGGGSVFVLLAGTTILLLALSVAATLLGRRRAPAPPPPVDPATVGTTPAEPDLARAAELGLAEMGDLSRDPRQAIIACYLAMERELEKSPGTIPQESDTPSEVLARAIERHALRADTGIELVDLFEEARFSPHVMNEGHRADAVRALRQVQHQLQAAI